MHRILFKEVENLVCLFSNINDFALKEAEEEDPENLQAIIAAAEKADCLVMGAFGCGAYKLPSDAVAQLFRQVMDESEFAGKFRLLVFAIMESTRKPNGLDGKFAPFYNEFGTYNI